MRILQLLLFVFLGSITAPLRGQNCGCADEGNCPFPFPANSVTTVCYDIADAFNNNLANASQGVCGVHITFRDGKVGNLELTLISPDGTQVQLVDATGTCNTNTPVAVWDILFVPCSEPCLPDTVNNCPYPCQFDACPDVCPWANAAYDGSYHPFVGCLEDFDTGPANGQWCLEIGNSATFNGGNILDFEVILCDQTGYFCCDADAGSIAFEPDVDACAGDSALVLDLDPQYGAIVPDPAEYDFSYAIFQNDTLLGYDSLANLIGYLPGTYKVCGLSWLTLDSAGLFDAGTPLTPQILDDTLRGAAPPFCGNIDLACVNVRIGEPVPPLSLSDTICVGDTALIGTSIYTLSGIYSDTLASFLGCDSVVNLTLTVLLPDTTDLSATVCPGDSVFVGNDTFFVSGNYEVLLQNLFGCDSLVQLDLTVLPPNEVTLTDTICFGDTVFVGTSAYVSSGIYTDTLISPLTGCDSTVTLDLTVVFVSVSIGQHDTLNCQQTSIPLNASAATTLGSLAYQWTTNGMQFGTAPTVSVSDPGEYVVSVTSTAGCSATDTTIVLENAAFPTAVAVSISPDTLNCVLDSVQLDGSASTLAAPNPAGMDFEWTFAGGVISVLPNAVGSAPGIYTLSVTDLVNGCVDTAQVVVFQNIMPPTANAGVDLELSCGISALALDGSASAPAGNVSFEWSVAPLANGNILPPANTPNPQVDAPGTYQLIVTDLENACRDTDLVVVNLDTLAPNALIALPDGDSLNCTLTQLTLDGNASSGSQNVVVQWIGNVVVTGLTAVATEPGNYSLLLSDILNGCADTATVTIFQDTIPPLADAGTGDTLSCTVTSVNLGGTGTSTGANFSHSWIASPGGSFFGPTNSPTAVADSAGTYTLTVLNLDNGCSASDAVLVDAAFDSPIADAGADGVLNCQDTTFLLDGSGSTIVQFATIIWTNADGDTISFNPQVQVNYPGIFVLTVSYAFCDSSDTVVVVAEAVPPLADAGPDASLDCLTGQVTLNGSGSSQNSTIIYVWTGPPPFGGGAGGVNALMAIADEPGTYILTVTDTSTNCVSMDTVLVFLDTAACVPLVDAGADGLVNCDFQNDTLQASGSVGAAFSYSWVALSGTIVNVNDPFAPVVKSGEFVFTVTNDAVGLSASDTVLVVADTLPPIADAGIFILPLNCEQLADCYELDASGSSTGANFSYFWEASDGSFCTDSTLLNVEILGEGIYNLFVTNTLNGCSASDAVLVQLLDFEAVADAGPDIQMLCGETSAFPDGSGSSAGGNYAYNWFTPLGIVIGGGGTSTPEVAPNNPQDTFFIEVLNTINLCRDTDFMVVFAPTGCFPECSAAVTEALDCNTDTVQLSGAGSGIGADISYLWATLTPGANLCGSASTLNSCADAGGIYQLTVTRTYPNGAQFSTECTVQVEDNGQPPTAEAGLPQNITCVQSQVTLDGTGSSVGAGLIYGWTNAAGGTAGIVSGQNSLMPLVNVIGTYTLTVTDTSTACFATDFVAVGLDTLHPVAEAGAGTELTCGNGTAVLNGSATPQNVDYQWASPDGGDICAGADTPDPVVCDAGTYILTVTIPANGCTDSDFVVVTKDSLIPDPDAGPDLNFTCIDTQFVLNATATGGILLTYDWTTSGGCILGASDILQPTVGCPGNYTLTVTDVVNGCSAVSQMTVIPDTIPPLADAGEPQEINCSALVVTLDGSGSTPVGQLDFQWVTPPAGGGAGDSGHFISGENTDSPVVDSAGIYQLIVTDQVNGCKDSAQVSITRDTDIPLAMAGPDTTLTCTRIDLRLDGDGSSAGFSIFYEWAAMPGNIVSEENTLHPLIDLPGMYVLTVTDTGSLCVVTDTVLVTLDNVPPLAAIVPLPDTVNCAVPQITLDGSLSTPAGELDFAWTTAVGSIVQGVTSPVVTVDSSGTYTLTVTHQRNGCTASAAIFVAENFELPDVLFATAPLLNCVDTVVQLEVFPPILNEPRSYLWSGPLPILGADTRTPMVSKPGLYFVTVTDELNGCPNSDALLVLQNLQEPVAVASSLGKLDCDHLTTQVSAEGSSTGQVTYAWTTTSGGIIHSPNAFFSEVDAPGWYLLTVLRTDNGCSADDSTEVIASSLPIAGALLSLDLPDCVEPEGAIFIDSIFGGTPDYFYSLNGSTFVTFPQFSFLDPGTYDLAIEDVNGCAWDTTVFLLNPSEVLVELGADLYIRQGESVELNAQISIPPEQVDTVIWQGLPDSTECPGCLTQIVSPEETTTYHFKVVDTSGCWADDKVTVWVNEERPFYIPTAFSPNGDGTNDRLVFHAGKDIARVLHWRIFDRWGDLVFYAKDFEPNSPFIAWDGTLDGKPMNPAVFVWKAEVEGVDGEVRVFYGDVALVR